MKNAFKTLTIIIGLLLGAESSAQKTHTPYPNNFNILRYDHDSVYLFKYVGNGNMLNIAQIPVVNIHKGRELTVGDLERAIRGYTEYRFHYARTAATIRTDSLFYLCYNGKVIDGGNADVFDNTIFWMGKSSFISVAGSFVLVILLMFTFPSIAQTEKHLQGALLCVAVGLMAGPILLLLDHVISVNSTTVLFVRIVWAAIASCTTILYWRKNVALNK